MIRRNDISAAEKLIRIIRDDDACEHTLPQPPPVLDSRPSDNPSFLQKIASYWKKAIIGIDIGDERITFVKFSGVSDQNRTMENYLSIPYDPKIRADAKQFFSFVRAHLRHISGFSRNLELWVAIQPRDLDIRYLEIPTVPKKQMAQAVFWTFHKKKPVEKEEHLFDFQVLQNRSRREANKTAVVAFTIPKQEIQECRTLFTKINPPLKGISASPFAFQNLLKNGFLSAGAQNVCCLHIGMRRSRIDLFFPDGTLALSRKIRACMEHMIDDIQKDLSTRLQNTCTRRRPSAMPMENNPAISKLNLHAEAPAVVSADQAHSVLMGLIHQNPPLAAVVQQLDLHLEEADILEMIGPALKRIAWRVERTIEDFCTEIDRPNVGTLYLSGRITGCRLVIDFLGGQFGSLREVKILDPFSSKLSLSESEKIPHRHADRNVLGTATGMALSQCFSTPNFLLSRDQREKLKFYKRLNTFILTCFLLISFILAGIFLWQDTILKQKNEKIADLRNQLERKIARNGGYIDSPRIEEQVEHLQRKRRKLKRLADKFLSLAVVKQISRTVPSEIRLLHLEADVYQHLRIDRKKPKTDAGKGQVTLEGIISGDPLEFETLLIRFLGKLRENPLLGPPKLEKRMKENIEDHPVLHFSLKMEIL